MVLHRHVSTRAASFRNTHRRQFMKAQHNNPSSYHNCSVEYFIQKWKRSAQVGFDLTVHWLVNFEQMMQTKKDKQN